jgi:alkanesulfonate monooxygenase SsuD/methylene tetrahydromethanopterin reductase-like flavin-dependent oxidoreductase (luciferase family)
LRPATVSRLEAAVADIRTLLAGGTLDVGANRPFRLHKPAAVPVWVAAGGPKTITMAGRVADGVYLRVGRDPANLERAAGLVRAGTTEAGRQPDSMGIGLVIHTITSQDPKEIAAISRSMAAGFYEYSPSLFEAAGIEWGGPPIAELKRQVWPDFHHAHDLVASGKVVDFLSQRAADGFSLFGTAADMAASLRQAIETVERSSGAAVRVVVPHPVPTPPPGSDFLRWFIEEVWPLV